MAAIKGRILALSWMMPPLVFPRSMQVARTLKTLKQFGWCTTVITALPAAEPLAHQDRRLADLYIGCYRQIVLDPCEDTLPSPWWLRAWRQLFPPQDIKADNWIRRAGTELQKELKVEKYDALVTFAQPWVDHLIGLEVKRRHPSLPWVVHFSDPWVDSPYIKFTSDKQKNRRGSKRDASSKLLMRSFLSIDIWLISSWKSIRFLGDQKYMLSYMATTMTC